MDLRRGIQDAVEVVLKELDNMKKEVTGKKEIQQVLIAFVMLSAILFFLLLASKTGCHNFSQW